VNFDNRIELLAKATGETPEALLARVLDGEECRQQAELPKYASIVVGLNVALDPQPDGKPGRIRVWSESASPVHEESGGRAALTLPDGSKPGIQLAFSLDPASCDYHPEAWLRWNWYLYLNARPHDPRLSLDDIAGLPRRDLRSRRALLPWA